jgi:hypothetical protein
MQVSAQPPGRIVPRAARLSRHKDGYLGAIARRFPLGADHPVDSEGARQYIAALDEIIADHRITGDEGWRMELLARRAGFTQQRLVGEHRKAWDRATADLEPISCRWSCGNDCSSSPTISGTPRSLPHSRPTRRHVARAPTT